MQGHAGVELEREHFARLAAHLEMTHAAIDRDAMLQVDDELAFDELGKIEQLVDLRLVDLRLGPTPGPPPAATAEDLRLADDDEAAGAPQRRPARAFVPVAKCDAKALVDRAGEKRRRNIGQSLVFAQELEHARLLAGTWQNDADAFARARPCSQMTKETFALRLFLDQALVRQSHVIRHRAIGRQRIRVVGDRFRFAFGNGAQIEIGDFGPEIVAFSARGQHRRPTGRAGLRPAFGEGRVGGQPSFGNRRGDVLGLDDQPMGDVSEVIDEGCGDRGTRSARRWGDRDDRGRLTRALRDRIELPDLLDLITEKIDAIRPVGGDGIDVDDAAAHGELAGRFAKRFSVVIHRPESCDEFAMRQPLPDAQRKGLAREIRRRGHRLQKRRWRRDDHECRCLPRDRVSGQGLDDCQPIAGDFKILRPVRFAVVQLGKQHAAHGRMGTGGASPAEEDDILHELFGGPGFGRQHQVDVVAGGRDALLQYAGRGS